MFVDAAGKRLEELHLRFDIRPRMCYAMVIMDTYGGKPYVLAPH